jgi:ureidoglycolate hydrolase
MKTRPPKILYRYVDAATAWECLKEGSLAFVPPRRFNDPFDTNPALDPGPSEQKARAMSRTRYSFINNVIGVACFTAKKDDPLMWAHYGQKHQGVMLGFNALHPALTSLQRVTYSSKRPSVDATGSNVGNALLVKSSVWMREKEWRVTAMLSKCEVKITNGAPIYVQRLNRKCFVSITFGCCADNAFIVAVANALKQWDMEHCLLRRLYLCEKTYSFKVRENTVKDIWQLG